MLNLKIAYVTVYVQNLASLLIMELSWVVGFLTAFFSLAQKCLFDIIHVCHIQKYICMLNCLIGQSGGGGHVLIKCFMFPI